MRPVLSALRSASQAASREVRLLAIETASDPLERRRAARAIVETIVGQPQPCVGGSPALRATRDRGDSGQEALLAIPGERIVDFELSSDGATRFLLESGEVVSGKSSAAERRARTLDSVSGDRPQRRRRKPAVINIRPGVSGQPARTTTQDPFSGLDDLSIRWERVGGGATLGTLHLNEEGNTILAMRVSAEDRNEWIADQFDAVQAMTRRNPDVLVPRLAIFAVGMSGTREVRHERAGPPPPHVLERDDMLVVDQAIRAGWVEHIVWRDADRIARDVLPGEMLLRRWRDNGVRLWIASQLGEKDYDRDWLGLIQMMVTSEAERRAQTARLRAGQLRKGPMAGKGWPGPKPYGFIRLPRTRDIVAEEEGMRWINRAFELAASGEHVTPNLGLSTRELAKALKEEGCPFDHERLRAILRNPIYTEDGEWYVTTGGVPSSSFPPRTPGPSRARGSSSSTNCLASDAVGARRLRTASSSSTRWRSFMPSANTNADGTGRH